MNINGCEICFVNINVINLWLTSTLIIIMVIVIVISIISLLLLRRKDTVEWLAANLRFHFPPEKAAYSTTVSAIATLSNTMITTYKVAFHRAKGIRCCDTRIAGYQISPIIFPGNTMCCSWKEIIWLEAKPCWFQVAGTGSSEGEFCEAMITVPSIPYLLDLNLNCTFRKPFCHFLSKTSLWAACNIY